MHPRTQRDLQPGLPPLSNRLFLENAYHRLLRPQKFQLLVFLRLARIAGAGDSNRDRHFSGDELQAGRGAGFFLGRAHHARCAVGLVAPSSPFNRRVDVFRRGLSPYFPWVFIRLLSRAARTGLDIRLHDFSVPDGRGVFWLSAAVGTNVVLGAQVITNLFSAIPGIGPDLALWIRGDYVVSDATLNRFFALHVIAIPLLLLALVGIHLIALRTVGSNNPDGIEIKAQTDENGIPLDGIPFHPYYTVHDLWGVAVFLLVFCAIVFFAPEMGGYFLEANNFIPADPMKTPTEIAPVWYFTAFYSMLRATTDTFKIVLMAALGAISAFGMLRARRLKHKLAIALGAALALAAMAVTQAKFWGVVVMGGAVLILFFLPWLDRSPVKSIRYRPSFHKALIMLFAL